MAILDHTIVDNCLIVLNLLLMMKWTSFQTFLPSPPPPPPPFTHTHHKDFYIALHEMTQVPCSNLLEVILVFGDVANGCYDLRVHLVWVGSVTIVPVLPSART